MKKKTWYGKTWHFLWHEDSVLSWVVNVVIAFILIKFVLYPLAGIIMGTSLPVVAVVSSSMDHDPINHQLCGKNVEKNANWWDTCGPWYEEHGIPEDTFRGFPFRRGFNKGDVMVLWRPKEVAVGDVIVFQSGREYPIIHRVVSLENGITTKGDHNPNSIEEYALYDGRFLYTCYQEVELGIQPSLCGPGVSRVTQDTPGARVILDEVGIDENAIIGKAIIRIPFAGWLKIGFVELLGVLGLQKAIPLLSA